MAAVYPTSLPILNDEEYSVERPVSTNAVRKLGHAINMLGHLCMIGQVRGYLINAHGVSRPNSIIYQYADGSEITQAVSPLKSTIFDNYYTPDMRDRFVRGAPYTGVTLGSEAGGAGSVNLSHAHSIGGVSPPYSTNLGEPGDEQVSGHEHSHNIANDLGTLAIDPVHITVAFFLKIN